jgi:hypothetical protein
VFKFLASLGSETTSWGVNRLVEEGKTEGHYQILKWCYSHGIYIDNHRNLSYAVENQNLKILKFLVENHVQLSANVYRAGFNCDNPQILGYLCTIATGEFAHFRRPLEEAMEKLSKSEKISDSPSRSKPTIRIKKSSKESIKSEKETLCKITIKKRTENTPPPVVTNVDVPKSLNQDISLEKRLLDSISEENSQEDELEDIGTRMSDEDQDNSKSSSSGSPLPVKNLTPPKAKRFSQLVKKVSPNPKLKDLKAVLQSLEQSGSSISSDESKSISPLVTPISPILKSNSCLGLLPIPMKPESSESAEYPSSKFYRRMIIDDENRSESDNEKDLESSVISELIDEKFMESVSDLSQSMVKSTSQTVVLQGLSSNLQASPNVSEVFHRRSASFTPRSIFQPFVPRKSPLSNVSTFQSSPEKPDNIDFGYLDTSSDDEILTEDDGGDEEDKESVHLDQRKRKRDAYCEKTTVESGGDNGLPIRFLY